MSFHCQSFALIALFMLRAAKCGVIEVSQCDQGESLGQITEIRVTDCYGAAENGCEIPLGTTLRVEIDFIPSSDIDSLTTEVDGILGGVHMPWDQVEKYPFCDSLGLGQDCPLTAGQKVTYSEFLDVCLDYPPVNLVVEWRFMAVRGDVAEREICFQYPVSLVPGDAVEDICKE